MHGLQRTPNIWQARSESAHPNGHSSPGESQRNRSLTMAVTAGGHVRSHSSTLLWRSKDEIYSLRLLTFRCRSERVGH